jgi:hypothetical protein
LGQSTTSGRRTPVRSCGPGASRPGAGKAASAARVDTGILFRRKIVAAAFGCIEQGDDAMVFSRCLLGAVVLCSLSTTVLARTKAPTLREQEEHACYNDATTLCNEFVPDETKITACMMQKRAQISPGCAKFFNKKK